MPARHAVLLTPSLSSRPIQPLSCTQITRKTPLIPVFVFKTLRTLSFSVSGKSCVCRSYENGRVCTNNSHSGTPNRVLTNMASTNSHGGVGCFFRSAHFAFCATGVCPDPVGALNPSFSFDFQLWTLNFRLPGTYPLSFHILADSFALSKKSTPLFSWKSTLFAQNTGGGGTATPACSSFRALPRVTDYGARLTILFAWKIPPAETALAPRAERPRWHRVPGNAGAAVREL